MNYEQWQNTTQHLIPVIRNKIAKNEPEYHLNHWVSKCGSYRCIGGDVAMSMFGNINYKSFWHTEIDFEFKKFFGFKKSSGTGIVVFGASPSGTLQERLDYVLSELHKAGHTETEFNGLKSPSAKEIVEQCMTVDLEAENV